METLREIIDPTEEVPVPWTPHDFGLFDLTAVYRKLTGEELLLSPHNIPTITRGEIAGFCGPCDNLRENGVCQKVPEYNQIRYAARKWCGQASINDERVHMTV